MRLLITTLLATILLTSCKKDRHEILTTYSFHDGTWVLRERIVAPRNSERMNALRDTSYHLVIIATKDGDTTLINYK